MNTAANITATLGDRNWSISSGEMGADQFSGLRTVRLHRFSQRNVPVPILLAAIRIVDGAVFIASGLASAWLTAGLAFGPATMSGLLGGYLFTTCLGLGSVYTTRKLGRPQWCVPLIMLAALASAAGVAGSLTLTGEITRGTPAWLGLWVVFSTIAAIATHEAARRAVLRWRRLGRLGRRVAVLGSSPAADRFMEQVASQQIVDVTITGMYRDRDGDATTSKLDLRGSIDTLLTEARRDKIDAVVIAQPMHRTADVDEMCEQLRNLVADIYLLSDRASIHPKGDDMQALEGTALLRLGTRPLDDWQRLRKAIFDTVLATTFVVILSPLLMLIAAIIRIDSPGPVLFRQPRQGFDNQSFTCLKFRTMHANMTDLLADRQTTRGDPRVTRVGRWLRRTSLDELPQLINVICGDMSLVGPRPHAPNTKVGDQLFRHVVGDYEMRHRVKPGITGWAQVNGWRGETATLDQLHNRVAFDMFYIQNWSLWLDLKILVLTVMREIVSRTAY